MVYDPGAREIPRKEHEAKQKVAEARAERDPGYVTPSLKHRYMAGVSINHPFENLGRR